MGHYTREEWNRKILEDARQVYEQKLAADRAEAEARTEKAVNTTEVSVLYGRGPQFVLEFTALIVIIFSAVVLGVLGRLDKSADWNSPGCNRGLRARPCNSQRRWRWRRNTIGQ
jgi:hypothetical protein